MSEQVMVDPAWAGALRAAGLVAFDDFLRVAGGPPASRHRHRETIPIELYRGEERRRCFLKRVFWIPPKHCLVPMLRGRRPFSQPGREWAICRQLAAAGLPAMQAVAMGERRAVGILRQAFVVVAAAPMAHTVEDWLVPGVPKRRQLEADQRRRLLHELGGLLRKLSAAGFIWPDAGAKHIFAAPGTEHDETAWRFCLIDLERTTRREGSAPVDENVAPFLASLAPFAFGVDEAVDFYGGVDGRSWQELRESALREVLRRDPRVRALAAPAPRLPDGFIHPRAIAWECLDGIRVRADWKDCLARRDLLTMDGVFACRDAERLDKPGLAQFRSRLRIRLARPAGDEHTVYLKRYENPPAKEQLRRIVETGRHTSTAARERRLIRRLWNLGIPTLDGIAFGEEMRGSREVRSFSMTEGIDGVSLETLAEQLRSGAARLCPRERRDVARQLAWLAGRMHRNELFHRDFYLCHVFLTRNARGRAVLRVIDLGRMIEHPRRPWRWAVKDLAALHYSTPTDVARGATRLRFLYDYLRVAGPARRGRVDKAVVRRLALEVERRVQKMARHDARRSRGENA